MQTAIATPTLVPRKAPARLAMFGDAGSKDFFSAMQTAGYEIAVCHLALLATPALCALMEGKDVILIDVSTQPRGVLAMLNALNSAIGIGGVRPRVLCFSTAHRNPDFVSAIQTCGARYVRVDGGAMLLEATEFLLWEMNELERHGQNFRITHRYSQGLCAPGEVIETVEILDSEGSYRHLPLALTERIIFEVLARHQRIASDSLQIVTSVRGEWFFRDYGVNAGSRQTIKLRRPTVKVSIERIRKALAIVFEKTNISLDPYDVLRSCLAAGTNRVLYKLHGRIEWCHPRMKR